jgi:hypothetical protein
MQIEYYNSAMWKWMIKNMKKEHGFYNESECVEMISILKKHRKVAKAGFFSLKSKSDSKSVIDQLKFYVEKMIDINKKISFLENEIIHIRNVEIHKKMIKYEFLNIANGKRA